MDVKAKILKALNELPLELDSTLPSVVLRADGPNAVAQDHVDRVKEARAAIWEFARSIGAKGFNPPWRGGHPSIFLFDQPGLDALPSGWNKSDKYDSLMDDGTRVYGRYPGRSKAGTVIKNLIAALPEEPDNRDLDKEIGVIHSVQGFGKDGKRKFSVGTGVKGHTHYFTTPAWFTTDGELSFFVMIPNVFQTLRQMIETQERDPDSEWTHRVEDIDGLDEILAWRPPVGWTAVHRVEMERAFANNASSK